MSHASSSESRARAHGTKGLSHAPGDCQPQCKIPLRAPSAGHRLAARMCSCWPYRVAMQLNSSFSCNSVIWIASLSEDELGPTRRMTEDVAAVSRYLGVRFDRIDVKDRLGLADALRHLGHRARSEGLRPILVLDAHGNQKDGLKLAGPGEVMAWTDLGTLLRPINVATGNNLCVIGAACFSLGAIAPTKLDQATPFYVLLAPARKVKVGFLEKNIPAFFRELFTHGSLDEAHRQYLSESFRYFHCEKTLLLSVARYIKAACRGKPATERRERLMTEVFMQGMENTAGNRKSVRDKLKAGLKPDQALLDRYAGTFLVGKRCSFTMEELLAVLDEAQGGAAVVDQRSCE